MAGDLLEKEKEEEQPAPSPMEVTVKESTEESSEEKKPPENTAPASRAIVGIIYPPPEVRNIVDKTADFVARNGPEFEVRIRLNEAGNAKFNFLNKTDPYHAYYEHKIKEIKEGVAQELLAAQKLGYIPPPSKSTVQMVLEPEVPRDPLPDYNFVVEPPTISSMELDIVKLTAQFVARNGAIFLDKLMMREQRNYQFDFLRKQHPLFVYFTKLVEQYSRVLLPPFSTMPNLKRDLADQSIVLERSKQRMLWEKHQKKQLQKAEEEQEKKRVEYARIDWHDFVIVETINFKENEAGYLPPPIGPTQLAERLLQQSKFERMAEEGGDVQEIEMEVEEEPEPVAPAAEPATFAGTSANDKKNEKEESRQPPTKPPQQPPVNPPKGPVQVRRDYNPKMGQTPGTQPPGQEQFLISPITGEKIPAEKMQEHMRYGLLDPRWIEDTKKQIDGKKTKEEVFAEGVQISSNLKLLAERRTDIFGIEETMIGQKIGEDEAPKVNTPVQWDGHAASADAISREAQNNIEEQRKVIQKAKEQAEKEQVGPTLLKTPINAAPPAHPPVSSGPPPGLTRPPRPPLPLEPPRQLSGPPHILRGPPPPHMAAQQRPRLPPMGGPMGMDMHRPPLHNQMQMMHPAGIQPRPGGPLIQNHPGPPGMMVPLLPSAGPPIHGMGPPRHPQPMHQQLPMQRPFLQQHPDQMGHPMAPPPKRLHLESEELIPEQDFVSKHPGPVGFKLQVPNMPERPEWKLNGQVLIITLPITDHVSVVKAKISEILGMPSGKQKLQIGPLFIKDSLSLGYYNFSPTTLVHLALKERGGRKK